MSRISIEGTPVSFSSAGGDGIPDNAASGHLLLIFEDDNGIETVIRGGPENDPPLLIQPIPPVIGVTLEFGDLAIENGLRIEESTDTRTPDDGPAVTPQSRGNRTIPLMGRSPEAVWNVFQQHAANIQNERFAYSPIPVLPSQGNSNAVVAELLYLAGIDVDPVLPNPIFGNAFSYVGKNDRLSFNYLINGTGENDIIRGRGGDQTFVGGGGDDRLEGGAGNDILRGSEGNDFLVGGTGINALIGGEGFDTAFYLFSYSRRNDFQYKISPGMDGEEFRVTSLYNGIVADDALTGIESLRFTDGVQVDPSEEVRRAEQSKILNGSQVIGFLGLEVPVSMADEDADYTVTLSSTTPDTEYNFALIIDISGSMGGQPIQDAKAAYISLIDSLIEQGVADRSRFVVIQFDGSATSSGPISAEEAKANINSIPTNLGGGTNFAPPINQAIQFFSGLPSGATNVAYFLSDGQGGGASGALQQYADVRAYGIGNASISDLNTIDSNEAVFLNSASDLAQEFASSGFDSKDDISAIEILVEDQIIETLSPDQFTNSPLGLTFKGAIGNLNISIDARNKISARAIFKDGRTPVKVDTNIDSGAISLNKPPKVGSDGDDTLVLDFVTKDIDAKAGNDRVIGNSSNNRISGGDGDDNLRGESGDDILDPGTGSNRIDGGTGIDIASYNIVRSNSGTISKTGDIVTVGDTEQDTLLNIEYIEFRDLWVDTSNLATSETIEIDGFTLATRKDNNLTGSSNVDKLDARGGNDTVNGSGGNDILRGGTGNDLVIGGTDNDTLYGDAGDDELYGDTQNLPSPTVLDNNYQTWLRQTGTLLGETSSDIYDFEAGDYNGDNILDLMAIRKNSTGTNSTEVHILDGATNYQTWHIRTGTRLEETSSDIYDFEAGDYNGDNILDLMAIRKNNTGTNSTEVHILDGATNYQTWHIRTGTRLEETSSDIYDFEAGDYNGDNILDLMAIRKNNTGTNSVEVHILDGATNYQTWHIRTGTILRETSSDIYDFEAGDYNGDNILDLMAIKKKAQSAFQGVRQARCSIDYPARLSLFF
ncbi:uncharacterized protein containing a von Willebrand factor type A (vWA) domain [Leptolyngbya sp. PCC 7375]|nr:uncharacterized protein containing a von Willebrand factor type A (vWA) domain [Leptolyngbya sp. PCC 7375]